MRTVVSCLIAAPVAAGTQEERHLGLGGAHEGE